MALNVKDKPAAQAAPTHVDLELALYNRWVDADRQLYERGKVYRFSPDGAALQLRKVDDGKPVFRRYVARTVRAVTLDDLVQDMTQKASIPVQVELDEAATKGRMEIGTPEEEAELFGGGVDNDEGADAGVKV